MTQSEFMVKTVKALADAIRESAENLAKQLGPMAEKLPTSEQMRIYEGLTAQDIEAMGQMYGSGAVLAHAEEMERRRRRMRNA